MIILHPSFFNFFHRKHLVGQTEPYSGPTLACHDSVMQVQQNTRVSVVSNLQIKSSCTCLLLL